MTKYSQVFYLKIIRNSINEENNRTNENIAIKFKMMTNRHKKLVCFLIFFNVDTLRTSITFKPWTTIYVVVPRF